MSTIVVYTAITGGRDKLKEDQCTEGARFIAFLDKEQESETWEVRPAETQYPDARRNARAHKIVPHRYFEAEYSIWMDGTGRLHVPAAEVIERFLGDADMALATHPTGCVYQEAEDVLRLGYDKKEVVEAQMNRYRQEGFPEKRGLSCTMLLIREHNATVQGICEEWWSELCSGSVRDQLSFDYCYWKHDFYVSHFPFTELNLRSHPKKDGSPLFSFSGHH